MLLSRASNVPMTCKASIVLQPNVSLVGPLDLKAMVTTAESTPTHFTENSKHGLTRDHSRHSWVIPLVAGSMPVLAVLSVQSRTNSPKLRSSSLFDPSLLAWVGKIVGHDLHAFDHAFNVLQNYHPNLFLG